MQDQLGDRMSQLKRELQTRQLFNMVFKEEGKQTKIISGESSCKRIIVKPDSTVLFEHSLESNGRFLLQFHYDVSGRVTVKDLETLVSNGDLTRFTDFNGDTIFQVK